MPGQIAFIIPAYNSASLLQETVESVFDGNFQSGDEMVIVDDASTDNTVDVVKQLMTAHPEIQLFRHRYNRGLGAAGMNTGIQQSESHFIFCLDHDNVLVPGCIAPLRNALLSGECDMACFAEVRYFETEQNGRRATGKWVYKQGAITLADALAGRYWPGPSGNYLFTRESWLTARRFDEAISPAIDSWDFGIRQLAAGCRMQTIPDTYYLHRQGIESQWVTGSRGQNVSLAALRTMLPILSLLAPGEERYLFSRYGRRRWLRNLHWRPIRTKADGQGRTGYAVDAQNGTITNTESLPNRGRRLLGQILGV